MPLYLGQDHPILLADGSLTPVKDLAGSDQKGIGLFVGHFSVQKISISKQIDQDIKCWKLISRGGRELTCANGTNLLAPKGKWTIFTHPNTKQTTGKITLKIQAVNYIPVYGTQRHDAQWIDMVAASIAAKAKKYPGAVRLSDYLCHLDQQTTEAIIQAIRSKFVSRTRGRMKIKRIPFHDQQLLFHLFDRTKTVRCVPTSSGRVFVGHRDGKKIFRERPTRSAKTIPKDGSCLREDLVIRYYEEAPVPVYRVTSQFGNIVEKSYVCRT